MGFFFEIKPTGLTLEVLKYESFFERRIIVFPHASSTNNTTSKQNLLENAMFKFFNLLNG